MTSSQPVIHASDAHSWSHCTRRVWYDHNPPPGVSAEKDPFGELMASEGIAHEARVKARFPEIVTARSAEHTQELMSKGAPVIYQPVLKDPVLGVEGRPDFLLRTPDGSYQVADAKLARSLGDSRGIGIQLSVYRKLLGSRHPAVVYLGNGKEQLLPEERMQDAEDFLTSLRALLATTTAPAATFSESKCKECPYDEVCRPQFYKDGEITLVYKVDSRAARGLAEIGIKTISDLAAADPEQMPDVPYLNGIENKRRAVLQAKSLLTGSVFQIAPISLPKGTWVHFDVETNPIPSPEEVYLWGFLVPPHHKDSFDYTWATGVGKDDKEAWLGFLRKVSELRQQYPDLILAHYSNAERVQIRHCAERFNMTSDPVVSWLLGKSSPLFDLRPAVTNSLILPLTGYGLKDICKHPKLVNFQWELKESGSQWSVVRYIDYLHSANESEKAAIKAEILSYNRDDVRATRALEEWLRALATQK